MDKEKLKETGLTEEQIEKVLKEHKAIIDKDFIPKYRFDEVNENYKTAKQQVEERDKQLKDLQKLAGDSKEVKEKLEQLEKENKAQAEKYNTQLKLEQKRNAVRLALLSDEKVKPFDIDMVLGLFDLEKIEVAEDGKILSGYKEQDEQVKKEKAFLFKQAEEKNSPQLKGWTIKGKTPDDSDSTDKSDEEKAKEIGERMAQRRLDMLGKKKENK